MFGDSHNPPTRPAPSRARTPGFDDFGTYNTSCRPHLKVRVLVSYCTCLVRKMVTFFLIVVIASISHCLAPSPGIFVSSTTCTKMSRCRTYLYPTGKGRQLLTSRKRLDLCKVLLPLVFRQATGVFFSSFKVFFLSPCLSSFYFERSAFNLSQQFISSFCFFLLRSRFRSVQRFLRLGIASPALNADGLFCCKTGLKG